MSSRATTKEPKGLRRVERWAVGVVMGVFAFVLEKVVMRAVKKKGAATEPEPTTITSKGGEAEVRNH